MTKTETVRFGQKQYSSGSDSFLRTDVNSDNLRMEDWAAYDDGATVTALPGSEQVLRARYLMFSPPASPYRTLYRATAQNGSWEQVIGNALPAPVTMRPYQASDQTVSTAALAFAHPNLAEAGGSITYEGAAKLARAVVYDYNDAAKGTLHVGSDAAGSPGVTGRAFVRTRQNGDRGLVIQPHAVEAGMAFTSREPGGQDVVTIDSSGYLRARALAGFGGGAVSAGHAVVIAPTSNASDGVNNGLLLAGQSGATDKTILVVRRDVGDTASIISATREDIRLGRLPWGGDSTGGGVHLAGRQIRQRALGFAADPVLWGLWAAAEATPTDENTDALVATFGRTASVLNTPLQVTQAQSLGAVNLTLDRKDNFNNRFWLARRQSGVSFETVAALEADGRMALGARWISAGTMFDARNSIRHASTKRWAVPGVDGPTAGQTIGTGATFSYTFPAMTARSTQNTDLNAEIQLEYCIASVTGQNVGAFFLDILASVNGGSFTVIKTTEHFATGVDASQRAAGNTATQNAQLKNIAPGGTVALQYRIRSNSTAPLYLRMMDVNVEECIVNSYTAA